MLYTFKINQSHREAIYGGACHSHNLQNLSGSEATALMEITRGSGDTVSLTDVQVSTVLAGLNAAIEAQSADSGDWERAMVFTKARDYLIAESRKQFRVLVKPPEPPTPPTEPAIRLVHSAD